MQIYLSSSADVDTEKWFIERGYSRLFSQFNDRKYIAKYIELGGKDMLLDSGAFSAFNSNKTIDIDDYIEYANSITEYCRFIVNLDVIGGDPQESFDNFVYIRKRLKEPLKLMPVFHSGEDTEWLYKYINYKDEFGGCSQIGLGAVARVVGAEKANFLDLCDDILSKYPNIWVHAFGITQVRMLKRCPCIDSADSSAWILHAVYRYLMLPHMNECAFVGRHDNSENRKSLDKEHFISEYTHPKVKQSFEESGISADELFDDNGDINRIQASRYNAYVLNEVAKNFVHKKKLKVRKLF